MNHIYQRRQSSIAPTDSLADKCWTFEFKALVRKRVNEQCLEKIKTFRAENWNKKFFGGTVQKDQYDKAFKTAQQSWATLDKEYKSNKSSYDKVRH